MPVSAHYRVEETTAVITNGGNFEDWETMTAYQVYRAGTNMARAVAKYTDEETAARVADFLNDLADKEAP